MRGARARAGRANGEPSRGRHLRRIGISAAAVGLLWLVALPPLSAGITGPCQGTATIAGVTYDASFDSPDNAIVVPEDRDGLVIPYSGSISAQNTNYLGAVGVVVGPATINVADWGLDPNDDDVRSTAPDSTYILGGELNNIVGIYELTAFHDADGGNCDANAMVKLEGSVMSTPIGAAATGLTVIAGAGVLAAGIPRGKK